jgi:hypothetical protein
MRRFNVVSRGRQSDYQRRTSNNRLAHLRCSLQKGGIQAPKLWCYTESDACSSARSRQQEKLAKREDA